MKRSRSKRRLQIFIFCIIYHIRRRTLAPPRLCTLQASAIMHHQAAFRLYLCNVSPLRICVSVFMKCDFAVPIPQPNCLPSCSLPAWRPRTLSYYTLACLWFCALAKSPSLALTSSRFISFFIRSSASLIASFNSSSQRFASHPCTRAASQKLLRISRHLRQINNKSPHLQAAGSWSLRTF